MNLREALGVLFVVILIIFAFSTGFFSLDERERAGQSVAVSSDMPFVSIRDSIQVYSDTSKSLSLDEVIGSFYSEQFKAMNANNSGHGFTNDWLWYRVKLHNAELESVPLVLEVRFPFVDYVEGYIVEENDTDVHVIQNFSFGDRYGFYERPLNTPHFTQPINFENEFVWLYMKIESNSSMQLPVYLGGYSAYVENIVYRQWAVGIIYGIAIALIFYNIVLYISLKDPVHLYYAFFAAGLFTYFSCMDGFAYRLWPNSMIWQTKAHLYIIYFTLFFSILFSRRFLGINKKIEDHFRSTQGLLWLSVFCALSTPILDEEYASFIMSFCITVVILSQFYLGVQRMKDGAPMSDFYVVIWGTLISITLFSVASSFGLFFDFEIILNEMKIISVVQLVFLSIAAGYKLNAMRGKQIRAEQHARRFSQEARKAEKQTLKVQVESNKLLESRVSERTEQLETALSELHDLNEKLIKLSEIDSLTGLYNRRKIESEYDGLANEAVDNGGVIGFLFVDIDHFKRFNDSYGHDVGDECLRQVSSMMKRFSEKYDLISGRLGGEEFVLLDGQSDFARLSDIAEKFRAAVSREKFLHRGNELSITVSIGGYLPDRTHQKDRVFVMREADIALYQAKENGRNCVVVNQYGTAEERMNKDPLSSANC